MDSIQGHLLAPDSQQLLSRLRTIPGVAGAVDMQTMVTDVAVDSLALIEILVVFEDFGLDVELEDIDRSATVGEVLTALVGRSTATQLRGVDR